MSNHITIELCAADRARIDTLIDRLEAVANLAAVLIDQNAPTTVKYRDDLTERLQAVVERAETPTEAKEETTPPITPIKEETPTEAEETEPKPTKTVSRAELGTKVRELMTKGYREQVKAIIQSYAPTVPGVPEDKLTECYEKLVALEG